MASKWRRLPTLPQDGLLAVALAVALALHPGLSADAQKLPVQHPSIIHRPDTGRVATQSNSGNMLFHGGPVMTSFSAYLIFWLPPGVHFSSGVSDANYEQLITRYFQDIGGSPFYNIVTQYPGSNGTPANAVTLGGSIVDTNPYPHGGTNADPLFDGDIQQEIVNVIAAQGWPTGLGAMYFVFTGSGIQSCFFPPHVICSQSEYCAYHNAFVNSARLIIYANMPDGFSLGDCGYANVTGDPAADVVISTTSHEHFEAATDPLLNAWYTDDTSGEIGDKCAYDYGPGGNYLTPNLFLNGHPYRVQREWSNGPTACTLSLCGTSVCPPAMTVSKTATMCVAGTPGNTIDYMVHYTNPSDVDAATDVSITDTLPPGVQWLSGTPPTSNMGNVLTFDLPDISVHAGGTIHFLATLTSPPAPFTLLQNTAALEFSDSLSEPRPTVMASATTAVPCGPWCGNGVVDFGEQCDAGPANGTAAACCTSSCTFVAADTPCAPDTNDCTHDICNASGGCTHPNKPDNTTCNDGSACTVGETCSGGTCEGGSVVTCGLCEICDTASGCVAHPRTGCKLPTQSAKAGLQLKNDADPAKDQLQWKWSKGAATDVTELGDPVTSDDYTVCIFDMSGVNPYRIFSAQVPSGGMCGTKPCWRQTGSSTPTGFKFGYKSGAPAGVTAMTLKASLTPGKAQMSLHAKGTHLMLPGMPLPLPARVQLQAESGACWEATFSALGVTKNDALQFKAKSD